MITPAVPEARIVFYAIEIGINVPEFLPNSFDKGPDISPVALFSDAGDKPFAAHQIIEFPVPHILTCPAREVIDDPEFGESEVDFGAVPVGPSNIWVEIKWTGLNRVFFN